MSVPAPGSPEAWQAIQRVKAQLRQIVPLKRRESFTRRPATRMSRPPERQS